MKHKDNDPDILSPLLDDEDELYKCTAAAVYKVLIEISRMRTPCKRFLQVPQHFHRPGNFSDGLIELFRQNCFSQPINASCLYNVIDA